MLELEQELKAKGINPTAMRLLIFKYLKQQDTAVSLSDIESSFELSDRVTIYRTLKTFESKGIIHGITSNNITQYALCPASCNETSHHDTHIHFHCKKCHKVVCLTNISIPKINLPTGFKLDEFEVIGKGVCQDCQS
ncbi:Fur family transcriptional regulator [Myroides sp. LJL119]